VPPSPALLHPQPTLISCCTISCLIFLQSKSELAVVRSVH
jgi:hypothetical protein